MEGSSTKQSWGWWHKEVFKAYEDLQEFKDWTAHDIMNLIAPWALMIDKKYLRTHAPQAQTVVDGVQAKQATYSREDKDLKFNDFEELDFIWLAVWRIWGAIDWKVVDDEILNLPAGPTDEVRKSRQMYLAYDFLKHIRKQMSESQTRALTVKTGHRKNPRMFAEVNNWTLRDLTKNEPTKLQIRVTRVENAEEFIIIENTDITLQDLKQQILDWYHPSQDTAREYTVGVSEATAGSDDEDVDHGMITSEEGWAVVRARPSVGEEDTIALFSEVDEQEATAESATTAVRTVAPGLQSQGEAFHARSAEETKRLLEYGSRCYDDEDTRIVSTRMSKAEDALGAGQEVDADTKVPLELTQGAFEVMQSLLSNKADCDDVARAEQSLATMLDVDAKDPTTIVHTLPNRSSIAQDPSDKLKSTGERHFPFQKVYLEFCLEREASIGGSLCVLGSGLGKTHIFLSLIVASDRYWQLQKDPITKPTLIVAPHTFIPDLVKKARDLLGPDYRVYQYDKGGANGNTISMYSKNPVFTSRMASKTVIVMSYNLLSSNIPRTGTQGLFDRIILDEAQSISNFANTRRGDVLRQMDARFRHCFTATVCGSRLENIKGLIDFLERKGYSHPGDMNVEHAKPHTEGETEERQASIAYMTWANLPEVDRAKMLPHLKTLPQDWTLECDCLSTDSPELANANYDERFCTHWPVGLTKNRNRAPSLDRKSKRQSAAGSDFGSTTTPIPPFTENPFDTWHPYNDNKLRCLTVKAFEYWIEPHAKRLGDEASEVIVQRRVGIILEQIALTRGINSVLREVGAAEDSTYGASAGLPVLRVETRDLKMRADELRMYHVREAECRQSIEELFCDEDVPVNAAAIINKGNGKSTDKRAANPFGYLMGLSSYLGLHNLRLVATAKFRQRRPEDLRQHLQRMKASHGLNPLDQNTPADTPEEILRQALWGAPKYREMFRIVANTLFGKLPPTHRKIVIAVQSPRQAELIYKFLSFVGIKVLFMDATVNQSARAKMSEQFRTSSDFPVLLFGFSLQIAGLDWHTMCCTVLIMEAAYNLFTEYQGYQRAHRIGSTEDVNVIRLCVQHTHQVVREAAMIDKASMIIAALRAKSLKMEDESAIRRAVAKLSPTQAAKVAYGIDGGRSAMQDIEARHVAMGIGEPVDEAEATEQ